MSQTQTIKSDKVEDLSEKLIKFNQKISETFLIRRNYDKIMTKFGEPC